MDDVGDSPKTYLLSVAGRDGSVQVDAIRITADSIEDFSDWIVVKRDGEDVLRIRPSNLVAWRIID